MKVQEIVSDFVNDPGVITSFHNEVWKEGTTELRGHKAEKYVGKETYDCWYNTDSLFLVIILNLLIF